MILITALTLLVAFTGDRSFDDPVQGVRITEPYARALNDEAVKAFKTGQEMFYCLFGEETWEDNRLGGRNRVLTITAGLRPKQDAGHGPDSLRGGYTWWVKHEGCPRGAVADAHAHPVVGGFVFSAIDYATWDDADYPYPYHIILFPVPKSGGLVSRFDPSTYDIKVATWHTEDGVRFKLIKDYETVPWTGPPTAR
jgi:hypothetical protein